MTVRPTAARAQQELATNADPRLATFLLRFFRTGPGDYGETDRFRGLKVPTTRRIARGFRTLSLGELKRLLGSEWHEDRLLALVVLVHQMERAPAARQRGLVRFYLANRAGVNNWDLVDLSAPQMLGPFVPQLRARLDRLSRSTNVWDRRISILAHALRIRGGETKPFLAFAPPFLGDAHDLIHKAVGWMLRECGKTDPKGLRRFLDRSAARMPRTMLRYAIEKFPPAERRRYMKLDD
jgi:3-methyladenine DNA glycosylase AlkD